jgi:hypothetical protein
MRSFIFCTSYINESSNSLNKRRYIRWVDYYLKKMEDFGAETLFLIDDGSSNTDIGRNVDVFNSNDLPDKLESKANLIHFENNLGRPTHNDYPGWWRSFYYSIEIARKYNFDKIIHIESDFFIVSERMIEYIKNITKGWIAFYCRVHGFPETAIQIISKDAYSSLEESYRSAAERKFKMDQIAELYFPFTRIEKKFHGDRLGQAEILERWLKFIEPPFKVDYIGQVNPEFKAYDFESFFEFEYKWE